MTSVTQAPALEITHAVTSVSCDQLRGERGPLPSAYVRDCPPASGASGNTVKLGRDGGVAGLLKAGGVFAISHGFTSLEELDWTTSGKVVLITVLGGIGTLWGGPLGAGIVVTLEDRLTSSGFEGTGIILGSIFVVTVLLFRHGIWGTVADLLRRRMHARHNPGD
jgi:branched-chain amino acid transport system permease protein